MKKKPVTFDSMEEWPLIRSPKLWVVPVGLPCSGLTTLSAGLENLGFRRYGPDALEAIRKQGAALRPGNLGYIPNLPEDKWRTILGPTGEAVQKCSSIVIDAANVERIERDLLTSIASWWGYNVLRVHLKVPAEVCLKRMVERERHSEQPLADRQEKIAEVVSRLYSIRNHPCRSEGRWMVLENVHPFDKLFELTLM